MHALEPEVFDVVFSAVEPLLPEPASSHPLGCHRPRVPDRICLWDMPVRLVTGCSWVDAERLVGGVSDTTLRTRREWASAGVFERLAELMLGTYHETIGLHCEELSVDGSIHKAPCGGEGTSKSPVDRGKLGWKWSIATDEAGIPIGWLADRPTTTTAYDRRTLRATSSAQTVEPPPFRVGDRWGHPRPTGG